MTPSPLPSGQASEPRRPRSAQTVSVNITEGSQNRGGRFQLELRECVETKTVTTTTRLTRKFPRVSVGDPTPLESLDIKEYPLATKPTPSELLEFSYVVPDDGRFQDEELDEDDKDALPVRSGEQVSVKSVSLDVVHAREGVVGVTTRRIMQINPNAKIERQALQMKQLATGTLTPTAVKLEPALHDTPMPSRISRHPSRSPSEGYPRHTRQTRASLAESPTAAASHTPPGPTFTPRTSQRLARSSNLHAVSDKLRRSAAQGNSASSAGSGSGGSSAVAGMLTSGRREAGERQLRGGAGFLATPDTSEIAGSSQRHRSLHLDRLQTSPDSSAGPLGGACDVGSPSGSDSHTVFSSNVATPPITDADHEPFGDTDDSLQHSLRTALQHRPTIDVAAAQDASLPSPRLSPTLAASQLHATELDDSAQSSFQTTSTSDNKLSWPDDSQTGEDSKDMELIRASNNGHDRRVSKRSQFREGRHPLFLDTQSLIEAFDSMKTEMKTFMMYQFLRRCPRPTLRVIADAVNPALKCDFLRQLPLELGYHVLAYLDHRDLCRAAQVSKHWRNIVDRNETGWKELLDQDGYTMAPGELTKAVVQGWGWQDPVGATGKELDLSMQGRLTSSEFELTRAVRNDITPKSSRTSKRKRGLNTYSASERSKRRAGSSQDSAVSCARDSMVQVEVKQHKSEGPLSAANAAAAAVPDPQSGLPSLRQLHLFKSIYRRHHMIRKSWTSGEVKPGHVAFAAHPRHVITCLQFDDDKIITGSDDTLIHIYDTKTGKLRKKLEGHDGGVWALQYEGNILVSGSTDRSVRVWDIERGLCQQVFYGHTSTVRCLQILMPTDMGRDSTGRPIVQPEKPLIITGSRDSQLRVWRLPEVGSRRYIQTGPPAQESDCPYFIRVLIGHTHSVRAISAYGDTLVSGSYDSTVRVWRISTGELLHVLRGHSQKVYSVVFDHKRNRCISGSMDSLVKIWDLDTGACLHTLEGHTLLVGLLDLRDERLVSAAADSTLRVWDPANGRCRNTLMAHTGAITCFQHDGQKVISGSEKTVKMWDVKTGECVQDLLTDLTGVWQVKFDGRRCVAAVQRDQLTYVEILDFGAVRDGVSPEELGKRILLNETEVRDIIEDGAV
ncbi:SCF ubiquitin ligase complex subunit cdc4 [Conoideocrella luteorostrata]|uniref:SCF ubiquitin ligase complex subunit cdc4 n=1 Tax=Conoideocrella luteorostrata TaxID=1105319 RepID=A0AAJ0FWR7_9HYPO|nr:SCF ubiquitin ligase complex subunit cdc4 [Conoideocrella luteorostrata]